MTTFLPSLKQKGHLDSLSMTLCSVGSRKISPQDDYASQGWQIFAPNLRIYGFDADEDACKAANDNLAMRQINWVEKHVPLALGKAVGESTLYVTQHPMCTSLYPPNEPFLARFSGLSEVMNLDFTVDIEITTLEQFCTQEGITEIDFLQVDVQGADLQVLEGAEQFVRDSVMAIQIEVEPSHLYVNQPLFADVDGYLRRQGYTLFDVAFARRTRKNSPIASQAHPGQILWGDAFYFYDLLRDDLTQLRLKSPERLLKLACIADVMDFPDYALEILEYLTLTYGNDPAYNFADSIIETLAAVSESTGQALSSLDVVANLRSYASDAVIQSILKVN